MGADAGIGVVGPSKAEVNTAIRLSLQGLPPVDLTKAMNEQLSWVSDVAIFVDTPTSVDPGQYTLSKKLSIDVSPFRWAFELDFVASKPGDYVLIIDWNKAPFELCHHRITIGGGTAPADPTKPVDPAKPQPPNQKITRVTWVWEKDDGPIPRYVATALQKLSDPAGGYSVVATDFEDDTTDGDGQVPDQYKLALETSKTTGVPVLVLQSDGIVVKTMKPKTEAEILEAVR
jgi:hypothetical protein